MTDATRPDPERAELEARAAAGNPDALEGLKLIDAATELVEKTSNAVSDALAIAASTTPYVRPSAALVAARRPKSAEPKPAESSTPLATLTASGQKVERAQVLAAIGHSFDGPLPLSGDGRQYVAEIPIEGRRVLGKDPDENAAVVASLFTDSQQARAEGIALTAALGCAPAEAQYGLFPSISSATAGTIELPELTANRGAVVISPTPTVYSLATQTGIGDLWEGGSKVCFEDVCTAPNEYTLDAHFTCITTTNTTALFHPERHDALISEAMRAHAQNVSAWLISELEAASVPFGDPAGARSATKTPAPPRTGRRRPYLVNRESVGGPRTLRNVGALTGVPRKR